MAIKRAPARPAPVRTLEPFPPYPEGGDGAVPYDNAHVDPSRLVDDLVQGARRGDPDAFAELYERFHTPVFRYLLTRVGNRIEAEDMASEVFVEAARRVRSFDGNGAAFAGWLFTIARHDLFDRGRAQRRRVVVPVPEVPDVQIVPDPADRIIDLLDAGRVRDALDELTEEQREVLALKFAGGLSNEEVAESLGKPIGAVKSLQHRGLGALKRILDKQKDRASSNGSSRSAMNGKPSRKSSRKSSPTSSPGSSPRARARAGTDGKAKARSKAKAKR